jgi:WD40 repeat protein
VIADLASGKHWRRELANLDRIWWQLDLSADGTTLIITQRDGTATVFDVAHLIAEGRPPRPREDPSPPDGPLDGFGVSPAEGAVRLGSLRFVLPSGVSSVAFARDGKSVFVAPCLRFLGPKYHPVIQMDLVSGKELRRFGKYQHAVLALSADGALVAVWSSGGLELWDASTGNRLQRNEGGHQTPTALAFSPDGTMVVAVAEEGDLLNKTVSIRRFRVPGAQELEPLDVGTTSVVALAFADGGRLYAACADGLRAWDPFTGKLIRHVPLPKEMAAALDSLTSFSRDSRLLFASPYVGPPLSPKDWKKLPDISRYAVGTFSADGKLLATGGPHDPICLWDPASGKLLRRFGVDAARGRVLLGFSPDAKVLVSAQYRGERFGPNRLRFWKVASGEEIRPYDGHAAPLTVLAHSPDGRWLASADEEGTVVLWGRDGRQVWRQGFGKESIGIALLAFPAGGKSLVAVAGNTVVTFDLEKKGARRPWTLPTKADTMLRLSRDGKTLILETDTGFIEIWDITTRKKLRAINCRLPEFVTLSPGGEVLATGSYKPCVMLWHVPSGRLLARLGEDACATAVFSRDGRILATSDFASSGEVISQNPAKPHVTLWEVATGQPISVIEGIGVVPQVLSFAPDGRTLLYTCWSTHGLGQETSRERGAILRDISGFADLRQVTGSEFGAVCLASGEPLRPLQGHLGTITCASRSPDGKSVVTGSTDGTLLVWDARRFVTPLQRATKLSSAEGMQCWQDLASPEAGRAYRAIARLAADPATALPLLQKHLRAETPPDPRHVARLLADLGHEKFTVRDAATRELEKLGELAATALQEAAGKNPSLEVARRLKQLQEKSRRGHLVPEKLRSLRALLVLERIGTPEARQLLQALARGAPAARLTQDARAALER